MYAYIPTIAAIASFVSTVAGHGYITGVVTGGKYFAAYDPVYKYYSPPPKVAGWTTTQGNGPLFPNQYGTADIICNTVATAGLAYVNATAGASVQFQWTAWPDTHHGPIITYIAPCNGNCSLANKATIPWTKIDQSGLISGSAPGIWATDNLIKTNNTYTMKLPTALKAGNYVVRHEIIALHSAGTENGAQNYPYCINFAVTGSGTQVPTGGVVGTKLYTSKDAGIIFNIYTSFSSYPIPGPALWSYAGRKLKRSAKFLLGDEFDESM